MFLHSNHKDQLRFTFLHQRPNQTCLWRFINEVYAKRIDDPYSRTFERCSKDTFKITGPCVRSVCYLYMLRKGSDGWKPESVKIYGQYFGTVGFDFDVFLPNGVWYGFNNLCNSADAASDAESLSAIV